MKHGFYIFRVTEKRNLIGWHKGKRTEETIYCAWVFDTYSPSDDMSNVQDDLQLPKGTLRDFILPEEFRV